MSYELQRGPFVVKSKKSLRDARDRMDELVEGALTGSYAPILILFRGTCLVGFRSPEEGWQSGRPDGKGGVRVTCSHHHDATRASIESSLRLHAAQLEWDGEEEESPVLENGTMEQITDDARRSARDDFRRWALFQKRYRAAHNDLRTVPRKEGTSNEHYAFAVDHWSHAIAGGHATLAQGRAAVAAA